MQHRFVAALVLAALAGVANISAAPPDGPILSLQLAKLLQTSDANWSGGGLAGSVAVDLPVSATFAPVLVVGALPGLRAGYAHENDELTCDYLVAAVRFTSKPQGAISAYFLVGYGVLRAATRDEVFDESSTWVDRYSRTGGTGLLAAGVIVPIHDGRLAIVGEVSALLPQTGVPGGGLSKIPQQILAAVGVRVALGR